MTTKLLLTLTFCVTALCGCSDRRPESNSSDYTVSNAPLAVTLKRISLSKIYEPNATGEVLVDVWCLLERTDGIAIDNQNNVTLGGLTLMRTNGQRIPPGGKGTAQTFYDPNNIPWEFGWGTGQGFALQNNQRLLRYRLLQVKGLDKVSQLNIEIRLGLSGQDQKLRSFLFERVLVR